MWKKILTGTVLAGLTGVLVFGAINRTTDRTAQVAEASGQGSGRESHSNESNEVDSHAISGAGNGAGRSENEPNNDAQSETVERKYPNYENLPKTWETVEGVVLQTPEDEVDLVIETDEGDELMVGTGPSYMATQGFSLQEGERVLVQGYWEDNEFKAGQLTRLADGQTVQLRDPDGRPAWAGAGRNAQGTGRGNAGDTPSAEGTPDEQARTGQAQGHEWLQFNGAVMSIEGNALIVQTADGEQITMQGRPWWFAQEQGFAAQVGDEVALTGFYEGEDLEVGRIDNIGSSQMIQIRDEYGRPLWAGR